MKELFLKIECEYKENIKNINLFHDIKDNKFYKIMERYLKSISKTIFTSEYYINCLTIYHNSFNKLFNINNYEESIRIILYLHQLNIDLNLLMLIFQKNIIYTEISHRNLPHIKSLDLLVFPHQCFYEKADLLFIRFDSDFLNESYIEDKTDIKFLSPLKKYLLNNKYKKCIIQLKYSNIDKYTKRSITFIIIWLFDIIKYHIPFVFIDYIYDVVEDYYKFIKEYKKIKLDQLLFFYKLLNIFKNKNKNNNTFIYCKYFTINNEYRIFIQNHTYKKIHTIAYSTIEYNGDYKNVKIYNKLLYEFLISIIRTI